MAGVAVPSECIDLLTFGVKDERSQILLMNVGRNWNEQMLQYCSTVLTNRFLLLFFFPPCLFNPPFPFPFFSADSSLFLLAVLSFLSSLILPSHHLSPPSSLPSPPLTSRPHHPDSVLCAVAVLSD